MTRDEFKDRLAIQLIPVFAQIMATQSHQHVVSANADPTKINVTLPDPQIVTAHVYGYCEGAAMVRDQHHTVLVEVRKKAKEERKKANGKPKMEVVRSTDETVQ